MYASMYRDLAAASGLYYYRLPSDKPDNVSAGMFYEQPWYDKCDGDDKHISSPAAFLDYECNSRSKSSPVLLNMDKLKATLELALDDIGCRDGYCQEQWWYINMKKKVRRGWWRWWQQAIKYPLFLCHYLTPFYTLHTTPPPPTGCRGGSSKEGCCRADG